MSSPDLAGEEKAPDFSQEDYRKATLNLLSDLAEEPARARAAQRAMLNILEDLTDERERVEVANRELQAALQSLTVAKAAADDSNRELEAFAYSVSHDLRAPLRAMNGFSQALLQDYEERLDDEGKGYLRRIRTASQTMARLIEDLLTLSRAGRAEMRHDIVDLGALADDIVAELRTTEPERHVEWVRGAELRAPGDARLLRQLLQNLLGNAWKFTSRRADARIEFGAQEQPGETVLFVRDNGAGFDPAYEHKLFGVFQRLHAASEFEGTGIGLAVVHRIVKRHGGRVWAEGAVDRGATFYFVLP